MFITASWKMFLPASDVHVHTISEVRRAPYSSLSMDMKKVIITSKGALLIMFMNGVYPEQSFSNSMAPASGFE